MIKSRKRAFRKTREQKEKSENTTEEIHRTERAIEEKEKSILER